jgi:hypothetical protein
MPGDPNECREHAAHCRELAARADTPPARATFLELAKHWERLATELDSAQRFLKAMGDLEPKKSPDESALEKPS